jgi:hypothetical protein
MSVLGAPWQRWCTGAPARQNEQWVKPQANDVEIIKLLASIVVLIQ